MPQNTLNLLKFDINFRIWRHAPGGPEPGLALDSRINFLHVIAAMLLATSVSAASAQGKPDAGQILRELERDRAPGTLPRTPAPATLEEPARPALKGPADLRVTVRGFRITRNTAFAEADLLHLLRDLVGRELSLAELQGAADRITRHYRDRDYFVARAYVPAQEIRDGIIEIVVLEGKLSGVRLKLAENLRLRGPVIEARVRAALPPDEPISQQGLERSLLLMNDLPGVEVRAVLSPGGTLGTSIVTVSASEGRPVTGSVDADNHGNKFSGPLRMSATLSLNDPSGYGDQLTARATTSAGTQYARLAYLLPIGASGLRLGAGLSDTSYRLCCEFASLQAKGDAQTRSVHAQYPFVRGREFNLYGTVARDARQFFNATVAGTTSDKKASVFTVGLNGDGRDFLGGGGLNSFSLTLSRGSLNLDGVATDRTNDATTAATHGRYGKLGWSLARLQRLDDSSALFASAYGQFASKNLDSSEKLILGGPYGVRAYPVGQASGDEGFVMNLEYRYDLRPGVQLAAFFDHGEIRLHRNPWTGWQGGNTRLGNRHGLSGAGVGLSWSQPGDFVVRASVAQRIGENPGRDANDNDVDNTRDRVRFWLQAVKQF